MVEIEHRQRQRKALAAGARELAGELLLERAPVWEPGELVGEDHPAQANELVGSAEGELGFGGENPEDRGDPRRDVLDLLAPSDGEHRRSRLGATHRMPSGRKGAGAVEELAVAAGRRARPG